MSDLHITPEDAQNVINLAKKLGDNKNLLTSEDVENVINIAKKFIENEDFNELNDKITYGREFDNFRRIYGDEYIEVIRNIIIEYGVRVQVGGCPPCFAFLARLGGKKVAQKAVQKKAKKKSRRHKLKKRVGKHARSRASEEYDEKKSSWW
jgi:hypothetical protein